MADTLATKDKILSKDYLLLVLCFIMNTLFANMYMPTMTVYSKVLSGSDVYAGFMPGFFTITCVISAKIAVPIIKKLGNSKSMSLGAAILILSCFCYYSTTLIKSTNSVFMLFLARGVQGLGFGLGGTASTAAVADVVPPSRLIEGISYYTLASTIVGAIAPAWALGIVNASGYRTLFLTAFAFAFVQFIISFFIDYERKGTFEKYKRSEKIEHVDKEGKTTVTETLGRKYVLGIDTMLLLPIVIHFLTSTSQFSINSYITLSANERGMFGNTGLFYTVSAVCIFLVRIIFRNVADRHGVAVMLIPAILLQMVTMYAIGSVNTLTALIICAAPFGIAMGIIQPTMNGLFFKLADPEKRADTSAYFSMTGSLSGVVVSLITGSIAGKTGYTVLYRYNAVIYAVTFFIFLIQNSQAKKFYKRLAEHEKKMQEAKESADQIQEVSAEITAE